MTSLNKMTVRFLVALITLIPALVAVPADGASITITMSGKVDLLSGGSVFAQSGTDIPVTTTFDVDNSASFTILFPSDGAAETLYGYPSSALSGLGVAFGTKLWDATTIDLLTPKAGFSANAWFNADLASATPTKAWMQFSDGDGSIQFGSLTTSPNLALKSTVSVVDYSGSAFGTTAAASLDTIIAVPEPAVVLLTLAASVVLLLTIRVRPSPVPER